MMKITKFAQSCVLIETKGKRILVDPGYLQLEESFASWTDIDLILVTHKHGDHCHPESIKKIMERDQAKFYTSQEVADAYPELSPEIVKEGKIFDFEGIKVEVVKAVHGYIPAFKKNPENYIHENVGYIIDDGDKKIYFTSDIILFDNDYKSDIVFVPVCNHGVVMGAYEAALFAKETGASLVIPYHYDNPRYPTDLNKVEEEFKKQELGYKILNIQESIEV
ncbi:MAG: MBL fold metallo-hydrolase [Nanoarchaeota archaeon]|nr:MBL fold metallo-hydrolase [Nanoarchaeota archaeon]MBU1622292.1 MBL fold metallo-hydrolase [Nanoarchaeota archaeon]MBU1973936.1 MBL fold metallo-hydrolase [Nanoarchaeota archaeon]